MKKLYNPSIDPYRILFPLGLVHAIVGTVVWILFSLDLSTYPGLTHPHRMMGGFLFSFATGFMMTAIPRFTGTARSSKLELLLAAILSLSALFTPTPLAVLGMLLFISTFFVRRFLSKFFALPPHFLFLPIGLILGITGSILLILVQSQTIAATYTIPGKVFLYHGTMLAFLLGIGATLISALLGWAAPPTHHIESVKSTTHTRKSSLRNWIIPSLQAGIFLLGFAAELNLDPSIGRGLRAICATWIGMQNWRLYRLPKLYARLPFWIWISAWVLLIGLWIHALFPVLDIHAAHLIFISGFGLMTLLVASRVILAHGRYPLDLESKSRIYAVIGILILMTATTRFTAQWTPSIFQHFAYAAAIWIVALIAWGSLFLPKMLRGII